MFIIVERDRKWNHQEAASFLKRMARMTPNELNKTGNPRNGACRERGQFWSLNLLAPGVGYKTRSWSKIVLTSNPNAVQDLGATQPVGIWCWFPFFVCVFPKQSCLVLHGKFKLFFLPAQDHLSGLASSPCLHSVPKEDFCSALWS